MPLALGAAFIPPASRFNQLHPSEQQPQCHHGVTTVPPSPCPHPPAAAIPLKPNTGPKTQHFAPKSHPGRQKPPRGERPSPRGRAHTRVWGLLTPPAPLSPRPARPPLAAAALEEPQGCRGPEKEKQLSCPYEPLMRISRTKLATRLPHTPPHIDPWLLA